MPTKLTEMSNQRKLFINLPEHVQRPPLGLEELYSGGHLIQDQMSYDVFHIYVFHISFH